MKRPIPTKPIRDGKIGDYVLIASQWYGRKSANEFNLGVPREGKIVKINPISVSVETMEGVVKFPKEAKITNDLSYLLK